MRRNRHSLLWGFAVFLTLFLTAGIWGLRGWQRQTLAVDAKVNLAFLDLSLRDRSRYLGDVLSDKLTAELTWPNNLEDILTRNHADFNRDIFLQVFSLDGTLVAASANTPAGVALSAAAQPEQGWMARDVATQSGQPIRTVVFPIYTGMGTEAGTTFHGYAQAGLLMPDNVRVLNRFTWIIAAVFLGLGLGCFLALRALLRIATQRMESASKSMQEAQNRFIGDAAHELGTPLAILKGEIDLALRRERSSTDYRAALVSCREEIERLSRLSENLLGLATSDGGQKLIEPGTCDAADIARVVYARFQTLAEERGIRFLLQAPEKLPWQADQVAIEQVLGNLISNALRHTPSGEQVELSVAQEASRIVFTVSDTGEGIPPAHLPRLFQRFHRVDKSRSRSRGGAGLGLAIVKTLVEAHGGNVEVESTLGVGSTFRCLFQSI
jgi:signal transduction histidine kinase